MRSDAATGLDWMATRAYDPTTGRFISRDPLGRAPLSLADNPYVYAGNNPLSNIDPSGQATNQMMARLQAVKGRRRTREPARQPVRRLPRKRPRLRFIQ